MNRKGIHSSVPPDIHKYELAARFGTVEEVVQRSLRKLEGRDLIEVNRQQIRIVNRVELENLAT